MSAPDTPSPTLIVTRHHHTLAEHKVSERKILIGRTGFADIVINDQFASKLHAMIVVYADGLVLVDLNSSNGVTVNSVQTKCAVLQEDDIIQIGNHRIKIKDAPPLSDAMAAIVESGDTVRMKTIVDAQRLRAAERKLTAIQNRDPSRTAF